MDRACLGQIYRKEGGRGVGRAADGRGSVGLPGLVHGHAPGPGTVPDMEKAFDKCFLNIYRMAR